jgi:hypothetical protein
VSRTATAALSAAAVAMLGVVVSACAPTTYDATLATTTTPSTTTLPTGTAAELLEAILNEVEDLGRRVAENDADTLAVERIEQLWAGIADEVTAARPDLAEDFDFVITRCRLAVDRQRPADADRAYKNLVVLVDEYVSG